MDPTYTLKTICVCLESSVSTKFISTFPVFVLMSLKEKWSKKKNLEMLWSKTSLRGAWLPTCLKGVNQLPTTTTRIRIFVQLHSPQKGRPHLPSPVFHLRAVSFREGRSFNLPFLLCKEFFFKFGHFKKPKFCGGDKKEELLLNQP